MEGGIEGEWKNIDKLNKHLEALTQFFSFSKNYKIHHPDSKLVIEFSILEMEGNERVKEKHLTDISSAKRHFS